MMNFPCLWRLHGVELDNRDLMGFTGERKQFTETMERRRNNSAIRQVLMAVLMTNLRGSALLVAA
jgi:hypothetical protein